MRGASRDVKAEGRAIFKDSKKVSGYAFTLLAVFIFAVQDGFSKYLGERYSPIFITMIRYWVFAAFVILLSSRRPGGLRGVATTKHPALQIMRGVLLVAEIAIFVYGLAHTGLAITQAIFQASPLIVTVLSIPFLGEHVGWRRWLAVLAGLLGVLLIINPTGSQFSAYLLLPLTCAFMFATYSIATRAVSRQDQAFTSLFYTAVGGAIAISLIGPFYWTPIAQADWPFVAALGLCGAVSHYSLIRAYDSLQASDVQPLTYLQLVVGAVIAVAFFGETLSWNMLLGATIVVGAGLFTMWREPRAHSKNEPASRSGIMP
ncbi:Permease of the drug/metabolite transporter (DMT) superfamily [Rhizobium tibeticum]|uniref:Carboxylate/amino acid/amine transporter n=1 Tax=Rhizobium tibeticum TaxID=501024 RepID=A0A1H8SDK1_9HYPH|nr:DMT family transporter [Rhizobium tibeticum]SEI12279.1 carboxylate/amino acid/amine transporter [Rhizobium tibeticum]SEO76586.1 Permease of the drug/metabolite transporter (DMT) superfamily [Rhizobium tibeticum]